MEGIAVMNEYGEYFYDTFLENINKYQFNKILDVGNITVNFCVCTKIHIKCSVHLKRTSNILA